MSSVTVESEEKKKSKGRRNSSAVEDTGTYGESGPLKKGPWTSAEDAILVEYVTKHGEGNWNNVQKNSGLSRCGKSCRLRWANHLRPDLKKGPFTPEEEQLIIELHSKMGNKWARMAAELPGRTDNEIKNYWNTRIKRRVRVGLPIYPPDLQQVHDKNEGRQDMMTMQTGPALGPDVMQNHELEFADVEFKSLDFSQEVLSYSSDLLDISACGLLKPGVYSSPYDVLFPSMHPAKRPRELGTMFSDQDGSITSGLQALNRWTEYSSKGVTGPFCLSSPYDSSLSTNSKPPTSMLSGSHALLNGNSSSSSESLCGTVKLELPSLQYTDTQQDGVGTPVSPLPSFESDTFVLSPPLENLQTYSFSPHGSGLLAEVVSQNLKNPNKYISDAPFAPDGSFYMGDPYETDCDLRGDPNSPLATSVFSNSTSISGPFLDEPASDFKPENILVQHYEKESPEQIDYSGRPDYLLGKMCH